MRNLETIILELLTKAASRGIQNVDFVGKGSMAMMSYTHTVGTSTRGAISAIEEKAVENSSTMSIIIL